MRAPLLAAVGILAFGIRLIHVQTLSKDPVFAVLLGDSKRYVEWAADIAGGNWLGSGAFYQAPLYPYALATLFSAFGQSIETIRIAQAVAGASACVLVTIAGSSLFDRRPGLLAGIALALYPPAIFFDGHVQKSSLDLLLMAALILAVARYQTTSRTRWLILLGLSFGCLTMTRENARLLFPVFVVWLMLWHRRAPHMFRMRSVAVFGLAALVVIAPVVVRNYYVAGELLV